MRTYHDYHNFGIVGEPYFDIDFNEVLYLTVTGRRCDEDFFNIIDKPIGGIKNWQKAEGGWRKVVRRRDLEIERPRDKEIEEQCDEIQHSGKIKHPLVPQSLSPLVTPSPSPPINSSL